MNISDAKIARLKAGLRQIDLAQQVGTSTALIGLYESGDPYPSPALARKINTLLGGKVYSETDPSNKRTYSI
jgi:ribosome-binding protein aMBF1 (putative translation factor)